MLEPCDGKLSRTVLRGEGSREAPDLPGALLLYLIMRPFLTRMLVVQTVHAGDCSRIQLIDSDLTSNM